VRARAAPRDGGGASPDDVRGDDVGGGAPSAARSPG
jgi:hypothetical protein